MWSPTRPLPGTRPRPSLLDVDLDFTEIPSACGARGHWRCAGSVDPSGYEHGSGSSCSVATGSRGQASGRGAGQHWRGSVLADAGEVGGSGGTGRTPVHGVGVVLVQVVDAVLQLVAAVALVDAEDEEVDVGVQRELIHGVDTAHVVEHEEQNRRPLGTRALLGHLGGGHLGGTKGVHQLHVVEQGARGLIQQPEGKRSSLSFLLPAAMLMTSESFCSSSSGRSFRTTMPSS